MTRPLFAVIGNPIEHSLSPLIHKHFAARFDIALCYEKIYSDWNDFEKRVITFFKEGGKGLNVTSPFKERAFLLADVSDSSAVLTQSANTLWMVEDILHAANTDVAGFKRTLTNLRLAGKNILLLGTGGAARSVVACLNTLALDSLHIASQTHSTIPAPLTPLISSNRSESPITIGPYEKLDSHYDVIINATSIREVTDMKHNSFFTLLENISLEKGMLCYDLAYTNTSNPTAFLAWAAQGKDVLIQDGLEMLIEQAAYSFLIWQGLKPSTELIKRFLTESFKKNTHRSLDRAKFMSLSDIESFKEKIAISFEDDFVNNEKCLLSEEQ